MGIHKIKQHTHTHKQTKNSSFCIMANIDYEALFKKLDGVSSKKIAACFNEKAFKSARRVKKKTSKSDQASELILKLFTENPTAKSNQVIFDEIARQFNFKNLVQIRRALKELISKGKLQVKNGKIVKISKTL